ncbi:MAG: hypothetical protein MSH40_04340 [Christensenella sp.]|nr:hypothetical protein [Christensenella sp.]
MLQNNSNFETTDNDFSSVAFNGSMQKVLDNHIGENISAEFLIGSTGMVNKSGILYDVGEKYMVIYNPSSDSYTLADIFNLKFATFLKNVQNQNGNYRPR